MNGGASVSAATELDIMLCLIWCDDEGEASAPVVFEPGHL